MQLSYIVVFLKFIHKSQQLGIETYASSFPSRIVACSGEVNCVATSCFMPDTCENENNDSLSLF
jgi:hypothetical protein